MTDNDARRQSKPATAQPAASPRLSLLWAVPSYAHEIARLHTVLFEAGWDEAAVQRLLAHPGSVALIARQGQQAEIGGFALAQVAADEAEILTLGVAEVWRRQGVGSGLVDGLKRAASRAGARRLFLEVGQSNEPARALYRRAGFEEAGTRKGYYARAGAAPEDAVVMRCELATPAA
ncbi:MAG: ribosomal protein S18-alanine N-acetyltransferase [Hyphomicrobiaceae bacterium]